MLRTKARTVRVAAIAAIGVAGLLMTAGAGAAATSPAPQKDTPRKSEWTQTGTGALITENGSTMVVSAVKNSVDGDGATVANVTLDGNHGTETATRYTAKGVAVGQEEFTLGAPDATGMIPITGSGKCVKGGTGPFKNQTCDYTFTATQNPQTNVVTFEITGTTTR